MWALDPTTGGVVLFQANVRFCKENAKLWPILAPFGYFIALFAHLYRPKKFDGVPKLTMYGYSNIAPFPDSRTTTTSTCDLNSAFQGFLTCPPSVSPDTKHLAPSTLHIMKTWQVG